MKFYEDKINELGANLKDLESIVQGKSNNLRVVEDGMFPRLEIRAAILMLIYLQSCARKLSPPAQRRKPDLILDMMNALRIWNIVLARTPVREESGDAQRRHSLVSKECPLMDAASRIAYSPRLLSPIFAKPVSWSTIRSSN